MDERLLRVVAREHAESMAHRIADLIREECPNVSRLEHAGVAAAALATAATMLDGTENDAARIKANGVARILAHCCERWKT